MVLIVRPTQADTLWTGEGYGHGEGLGAEDGNWSGRGDGDGDEYGRGYGYGHGDGYGYEGREGYGRQELIVRPTQADTSRTGDGDLATLSD